MQAERRTKRVYSFFIAAVPAGAANVVSETQPIFKFGVKKVQVERREVQKSFNKIIVMFIV